MRLKDDELARLIRGGEDTRVEFKESLAGDAKARIREAICAFANDLSGSGSPGIVIVGLKDDASPTRTVINDELLRTLVDMKTDGNIVPPPVLICEKRQYDGHDVAVVTVRPSDSPPVRCKGLIHIRSGPRRGIANAQEERILNEKRRCADRPFDVSPIAGADHSELNRRMFEDEYLPGAVDREHLRQNDRSLIERLAAAKMIESVDDDRATILGLLVAGIRPRDFIPGAYVQFLRIAGTELADEITDALEVDGTITDTITRLEDKLRSHNHSRVDLISGDREKRAEKYPIAALQQLVRNAIMHRDYETTNSPVRVTWFDDRIEIQNPGGPYGVVTKENFALPGITDYRNPNLAEAMKALGFVQRFGVGIANAQRLMHEAGHAEIDFSVEPEHILATVRAARAPSCENSP